jgi:hypothetical protein
MMCSASNVIMMIISSRTNWVANERSDKCTQNFNQRSSSRKRMRDKDEDWNIVSVRLSNRFREIARWVSRYSDWLLAGGAVVAQSV